NLSELDYLSTYLKGIGEAGTTSNSINYYSPLQNLRLDYLRGDVNQQEYDSMVSQWRKTDYRTEYMDSFWRNPVRQNYNLSINSSSQNQSTFASLNYVDDG